MYTETETKKDVTLETPKARKASGRLKWIKLLLRSKTGTLGLVIVLAMVGMAVFADVIAPYNPAETDIVNRLLPPAWVEGGNPDYLLGTDNLGRDILSRIIVGSRVSLLVGISAVVLAGAIGLLLGLLAGFYGKWIDTVIMRTVDSFLAIPNILFMLIVLAVIGPSLMTMIFALGGTTWVVYARMVRGETLSVKERDYVRSARAVGAKDVRIIWQYILPNIVSSFIVIATLNVATTIILESSLSFLGLGIQPPDVSWGLMLSDGREYLATSWWVATFPGIAITITVLGIIFLGDWLRDVLDPKMKIK
ncbi:ABC transporter permease [Bacillus sp. Marseille-Q3570]|uniref:ABC transporter permease n=1 Tax=Bacillus sp. Marseille-Q3570 TaxID=2963522 RepID=UPI0021B74FA4|nr:ABC transporter permease [Bacillus sp. Marseille-Q3570]